MAFTFYRPITVNAAQVPSTQTSFPMLISGTYSYLAYIPNGGKVQNINGYDIGFYSDAALTTKLSWETESYNATTGAVIYWVNVPSIANGTVIYMAYGNPNILTNQSTPTSVWDSNFKGVWHLPNGTTLTANDSTINANNGAITGGPTAVAGQIDGAAGFAGGASTAKITVTQAASLNNLTPLSASAWVNFTAYDGTARRIMDKADSAAPSREFILFCSNGGGNTIDFQANRWGTTVGEWTVPGPSTGVYHHVVVTYPYSTITDVPSFYIDAVLQTNTTLFTPAGSLGTDTSNFYIGTRNTSDCAFNGSIDEVRLSGSIRSADWITAEYNNQSSPSTFYAVGNESATFFTIKLI